MTPECLREMPPCNASENIKFAGGVSKLIRDMRDSLDHLSQQLACIADLVRHYETDLNTIANAKNFDNIGNWAKNIAKNSLKEGQNI